MGEPASTPGRQPAPPVICVMSQVVRHSVLLLVLVIVALVLDLLAFLAAFIWVLITS